MEQLDPDAIVERVLRFAETRELFRQGAVVVAVSGGQDSVCMLDILRRLQSDLKIELWVAHLNHMFRGAEAEADAEFVRALAERWGLPVEVAAIDVPSYRSRHRLTKQVAARYARYRFLARAAAQCGAPRIAVGHTAGDAVETLLINLLRGSGLAGMVGILPSRPLVAGQLGPELESQYWRSPELPPANGPLPEVIRPILDLSRVETEGYCRARSLPFRQDPSNLDTAYRRNWIRTKLIPLLEHHAPGVSERLRNTSELLADDYALVNGAADQLWLELATVRKGQVAFDLAAWGVVRKSLQRHLLRRTVEAVAGSLEGLERAHVDMALDVIRLGQVGAWIDLPSGVYLERGYNSFWLAVRGAREAGAKMPEDPAPLPVPGSVVLPVGTIEATLANAAPEEQVTEGYWLAGRNEAYLDADKVGPSLDVRRRRPGDRLIPLGMSSPKKLHDFLIDQKVPRGERDRIPIVGTPEAIAWVAGFRIDERFKVTADTKRILVLKYRG